MFVSKQTKPRSLFANHPEVLVLDFSIQLRLGMMGLRGGGDEREGSQCLIKAPSACAAL